MKVEDLTPPTPATPPTPLTPPTLPTPPTPPTPQTPQERNLGRKEDPEQCEMTWSLGVGVEKPEKLW